MYEKGARMCGNERAWLWCESKRELVTPHVRSKTMFYPCTRSSLHNRTAILMYVLLNIQILIYFMRV